MTKGNSTEVVGLKEIIRGTIEGRRLKLGETEYVGNVDGYI